MSNSGKTPEIETLVNEFQRSGLRELHVRADGFELYLSNDPEAPGIDLRGEARSSSEPRTDRGSATSLSSASGDVLAKAPETDIAEMPPGSIVVRAPYLGTFYRSPKPGSPVFVEIGSAVTPETDLCLVEVMKLFTAVRADISGIVHAVLAPDGQMVQAEQPLFIIRSE